MSMNSEMQDRAFRLAERAYLNECPESSVSESHLVCCRCEQPIYEGEAYYELLDGTIICESCIDDFRHLA